MISTFTAFIDANVFFGARLRSLIVELAQSGLFRGRWSEEVHREWMQAVLRRRADIDAAKLERYRRQMDLAVPDALVESYEHLVPTVRLPDERDRHIVAAAMAARASVIVTFNGRHFPDEEIGPLGLHTEHPDDFILDIADLAPERFLRAAERDWQHYRSPPLTAEAYAEDLRKAGLPGAADLLLQLLRVASRDGE